MHAHDSVIEARPVTGHQGPLSGLSIGVKDIFRVDGWEMRAGSKLPVEAFDGIRQGPVVSRLLELGATLQCRTTTAEFAWAHPPDTSNPLDPLRTPGGSSSGSAAAVASGLVDAALGTQTIGSVIRPASYCGVWGFKASYGRLSTEGVLPCSPTFDTVGWFARDPHTILGVAEALLGPDLRDAPAGAMAPPGGYLRPIQRRVVDAFNQVAPPRQAELPEFESMVERHRRTVFAEMAITHRRWFAEYRNLYFPESQAAIEAGQQVSTDDLDMMRRQISDHRQQLPDAFIVSPAAAGPAPVGLGSTGDPTPQLAWTYFGGPTVTFPAFEFDAMPVGLQVTAPVGCDLALVRWAMSLADNLSSPL